MDKAGYTFLIEKYELRVLEPSVRCFLVDSSVQSERTTPDGTEIMYPRWRHPLKSTWHDHLNFAIKYEGVNLEVLKAFFGKVPREEIAQEVLSKPTGRYCRRIWFLYEFLTGEQLPLEDVKTGPFVPLLDSDKQFALPLESSERARRQRIINNLAGNSLFCPMVRLTKQVLENSADKLKFETDSLLSAYSPELLYRAVQYLYVKETKSSFAIERETPSQKRMDAFVGLLKDAEKDCLSLEGLCSIQKKIVDERYQQERWRESQVYVGESLSPTEERVHYIAPKPADIGSLMEAYMQAANQAIHINCDAVVTAVIVAFAFVFLHPFDDGNGRTHRYLLHHVLARKNFTPPKIIFPVSAVLLKNPGVYDRMLESFSARLMPLLEYSIDDYGEITVKNDTADFYRFIDMTPIVEEFQKIVLTTIQTEWKAELNYLQNYDKMRSAMRDIVDMPDKKANQFIMFVQQNKGVLPLSRRKLFSELSDEEVAGLEKAVNQFL